MTETKHNDELVKRADEMLADNYPQESLIQRHGKAYNLIRDMRDALSALPKAPDAGFCDHCWRKRSEGEDICWECGNSSFVPHDLKAKGGV